MVEQDGGVLTRGTSRRALLRRGAVVGGSLMWVLPTVEVLDLTAKAAASTSGGGTTTPGSYPSNFVLILNIKQIPAGTTGWPAVGTNIGIKYDPGTGFDRPDPTGTGNCLNTVSGNPVYDNTASDVAAVTAWLNAHPTLAKVSQASTTINGKTVPSYTLVITNQYFKAAKTGTHTYGSVGFAKNGQACTVAGYQANSPSGFDTYLFPGQ